MSSSTSRLDGLQAPLRQTTAVIVNGGGVVNYDSASSFQALARDAMLAYLHLMLLFTLKLLLATGFGLAILALL